MGLIVFGLIAFGSWSMWPPTPPDSLFTCLVSW